MTPVLCGDTQILSVNFGRESVTQINSNSQAQEPKTAGPVCANVSSGKVRFLLNTEAVTQDTWPPLWAFRARGVSGPCGHSSPRGSELRPLLLIPLFTKHTSRLKAGIRLTPGTGRAQRAQHSRVC